jgi:hypothetical protein
LCFSAVISHLGYPFHCRGNFTLILICFRSNIFFLPFTADFTSCPIK